MDLTNSWMGPAFFDLIPAFFDLILNFWGAGNDCHSLAGKSQIFIFDR